VSFDSIGDYNENMHNSQDLTRYDLRPADPDTHLMAIARITSDAFAGGEYVDEISQQYIGNCHYDWSVSRLIFDQDRLVHHWGVWGYPMRLGSVTLKVAGIGAVVTEEAYRRQGLMALATSASFNAMLENGYDLSILRGRHYVKFGYARAWNYVTYRLQADEIPALPTRQTCELLGPDLMDEINTLYNAQHQTFSGSAVRPTFRMLDPEGMKAYGWRDSSGDLVGYVRAVPTEDKKTLQCLEAVGDVEQGLAVLRDLFLSGEYETLAFFTMPHQHPVLQHLRRGACLVEDRYFYNTGWRVRTINLHSTLGKIQPDLENRIKSSAFKDWSGKLFIDAGAQKASLEIEHGSVRISGSPAGEHGIEGGPAIARLLIGSDDPGEVIRQEHISCQGAGWDLAMILFPNLYPMMSHWDEY